MIEFKNVSFCYKDSEQSNSLHDINFHIAEGEVVLLCGKSGCGKTTITRFINGLIPHFFEGEMQGEVQVNGKTVSKQPIYETARLVGSVFQNPRSQFFNVDSTSEIVFGCENMGWSLPDIENRLSKIITDFDMKSLLDRNLFHLSGGEKQKIACACVTMSNPDVFVLDEPASNLDCRTIRILSEIIAAWKNSGKTVVIAEHRLNYLKQVVDRVIYMDNGRIIEDVPAHKFFRIPAFEIKHRGLRSVEPITFKNIKPSPMNSDKIELKDFRFAYQNSIELKIPSLSVPIGSIVGIIGNNGAGKTTLARCICGLERKAEGSLRTRGDALNRKKRLKNSYLVMQDVNHQLFTESVEEEVLIGMPGKEDNNRDKADKILESLDLLQMKELHPLSLSGGQKQRVAIASALSSNKELMVFDEPTSGLDYHHMLEVAGSLKSLSAFGKTIFIITHDPELIFECCNYIIFIENGTVSWSGELADKNAEKLTKFFAIDNCDYEV